MPPPSLVVRLPCAAASHCPFFARSSPGALPLFTFAVGCLFYLSVAFRPSRTSAAVSVVLSVARAFYCSVASIGAPRCVAVRQWFHLSFDSGKSYSRWSMKIHHPEFSSLLLRRSQSLLIKLCDDEEIPEMEQPLKRQDEDIDDIPYLCGKPFFDVVLTESHCSRQYLLQLPKKFVHQLPRTTVPVVLRYKGRNWDLSFLGNSNRPRFCIRWKEFAMDNDLKPGDGCVFELMECGNEKIKFKVHVLRGDLPPELLALVESCGTSKNPIAID